MKKIYVGGISLLLLFPSAPANALDGPTYDLTSIFEYVCFSTLPHFEGAEARLRQMGFKLITIGDNEFEGRHPSDGLTAYLTAGKREYGNSGCTIQSENAVYNQTKTTALEVFNNIFGETVSEWRYDGRFAGWSAPSGEGMVYLDVIGEGVDTPSGVGIAIEWRRQ